MAERGSETGAQYGTVVGLLSFFSYITVTIVTEVMAVANAVLRRQAAQNSQEDSPDIKEEVPLLQDRRLDPPRCSVSIILVLFLFQGKMAKMFFNNVGEKLFYLCIVIYLYGDMSIYVAAVPKSLRDTVCTWRPLNKTNCNESLSDSEPCWSTSSLTRMDAYRIFVACFILTLGPFVFFNVQKTKILQVITGSARWLAFGIMIVLAVMQLAQHKGQGRPVMANIAGVPNLFGVCVYSFMCHHSLPSLITPIKDKSKLFKVLAADYVLILAFYALLSFTGIYTFKSIKDLYTLNFLPDECGNNSVTSVQFFQYFLALFPVFTLSTNFPIIAITLRNNLQTLFLKPDKDYSKCVRNLFPFLAVIPPTIVAMVTNEVEILVGITGSYAGAGIQYVVPALLVYFARKDPIVKEHQNYHRSPFSHVGWIILILAWSVVCVGFVTVNHVITRK
ncbi:LOW QUALITY PROTEIN: transmembrane protein 104-like [Haliotis rubra]|uniref:LOW QUALITY PROTEIN: transmembrane protein 104-like n=1 Tax=Haliotis rubra TaxID=36100 RepID=UPI001EE528BD|nr:LOW QUALITY PROTEIN: transmembrane protein 104-like [Haliotis rubra]